jgi:hypothetical protein
MDAGTMRKRRVRRAIAATASVTTLAGLGVLSLGWAPAFAAVTVYDCAIEGTTVPAQVSQWSDPASAGTSQVVQVSTEIIFPTGFGNLVGPSVTASGTGDATSTSGFGSTFTFGGTASFAANVDAPVTITSTTPLTMPKQATVVSVIPYSTFNITINTSSVSYPGTCAIPSGGSNTETTIPVAAAPAPTAIINAINGQAAETIAHDGDVISFSLAGFAANETVTASLAPYDGGATIQLPETVPAPLETDSTGSVASATVAMPTGFDSGAYNLTFPGSAGDSTYVPLTLMEDPTCTATPDTAAGANIALVTCSNFDPGSAVNLQGVDSEYEPTTDPADVVAADGSGNISNVYAVNDASTAYIGVIELSPGSDGAWAQYPPAGSSPGSGGSGSGGSGSGSAGGRQTVSLSVGAGPLEMTQSGTSVTLSPITVGAAPQTSTGDLNQITVSDLRDGDLGWSLTASSTSFTGSAGGSIPASAFSVTPTCAPDASALAAAGLSAFPSSVAAGPAGSFGATAVTLCTEPAAAPGATSGGVFDAAGALSLTVPPFLPAGTYSATITISLG